MDLHYTCTGSGPDILLIHGWASSHRMWNRLVRDLSPVARCWAVDLYGFGQSPHPLGDEVIQVQHHLNILHDFCELHDLRPKAVIGHSMGGLLTLKLAAQYPKLVEKIVLLSPVVTGRYGVPVDLNRLVQTDWGELALAKSKPFWLLAQNLLTPMINRPAHWYLDDEASNRIMEDFQRASWQASTYALQSIARENMEPHLPAIQQPALVIVGSRDVTVPPDEGRLAARLLPHARLFEIDHAHHQPLDEAPEQVVQAVQTFLR